MITRTKAKKKIADIMQNQAPIKTGQKLPIRPDQTFNVYQIPLDLLVPNVLNDRITWRIREFEATNNRKLNIELDADVEYLYALILDEHKTDNDRTKADLAQKGQMVDGVITCDGIIIDGNRRASLLRALFNGDAERFNKNVEQFRYFNAIVLPGVIDDKEIMALETMIQVGSDKPVDYNRICLYIKVDNLLGAGYNHRQIKQYMGLKSEKEVEDMEEIFKLMVEYLLSIGKPNHFTLLDGLEDQFINTRTVFRRLNNGTYDANWDYSSADVVEFKTVCYDYMRAKFEGKKYRDVLVGRPNKSNGVFIERRVWENFRDKHNSLIDNAAPESEADWQMLGRKGGKFEQNLNAAVSSLATTISDKDLSKLLKDIRIKFDRAADLVSKTDSIQFEDRAILRDIVDIASKILKHYS